ncbi:MAG TPA: RnfH family protein [Chromatiaceae bacterium]|jgi:putative ubiquitin-RnfH superfamily antitoxin RatB of RatAB toxin-antitoxin module|nr:RnfH family protein [Chromatiaceae bacterium]HIB84998.1 RnfH family protein [Chromatiaceae bacterium]HIN81531.1 RnfH family protein [Chromatiales bacterium]HIO14422.1 RnfH family protein [Chromatiales bacterium]HIO54323.1 RnfH family protein [Chromatiales bacterium]
MPDPEVMSIEVVFAMPEEQALIALEVSVGCTVDQAIEQSGVMQRWPEIDLDSIKVGIFGKIKTLQTELREGDRVEIYRPLIADPKEIRRQRAAEGKAMKKGAAGQAKA